MSSFGGPCRQHSPCSLQGGYHHKGRNINCWSVPCGGTDLSDGYRRISRILVCGDNNSLCARIVGSWHIVQCPFFVRAVQM
jgi:hypothetical protein